MFKVLKSGGDLKSFFGKLDNIIYLILICDQDTVPIPRLNINIWETLISKSTTISMKDITIINIRTTVDRLEVFRDRFQPLKWDKPRVCPLSYVVIFVSFPVPMI